MRKDAWFIALIAIGTSASAGTPLELKGCWSLRYETVRWGSNSSAVGPSECFVSFDEGTMVQKCKTSPLRTDIGLKKFKVDNVSRLRVDLSIVEVNGKNIENPETKEDFQSAAWALGGMYTFKLKADSLHMSWVPACVALQLAQRYGANIPEDVSADMSCVDSSRGIKVIERDLHREVTAACVSN